MGERKKKKKEVKVYVVSGSYMRFITPEEYGEINTKMSDKSLTQNMKRISSLLIGKECFYKNQAKTKNGLIYYFNVDGRLVRLNSIFFKPCEEVCKI